MAGLNIHGWARLQLLCMFDNDGHGGGSAGSAQWVKLSAWSLTRAAGKTNRSQLWKEDTSNTSKVFCLTVRQMPLYVVVCLLVCSFVCCLCRVDLYVSCRVCYSCVCLLFCRSARPGDLPAVRPPVRPSLCLSVSPSLVLSPSLGIVNAAKKK